MKVEIKPLPAKKWHGKAGKEAFAQPKTVEVLYSNETGGYDTGLTQEEETKYSKLLGVNLDKTFNPNEPHEYWSTKASWIPLPNQTLILETSRNQDYVKVANLKASKYVANNMKEWEQGLWPDATHVIFSEEEEMELKSSKFQLQQKASVALVDMSTEAKKSLVRILSDKSVKGRSDNFIDGMLAEIVDEKPAELLRTIELGKEEVTLRATILELISKGILIKDGGRIKYMGEELAMDYEDAIKYFKNPENAAMKVRLLEKLQ